MGAATLLQQFRQTGWKDRPAPERVPTGIEGLTLPRGAITEICGPASSGRTSLMLRALAQATAREEVCALIDTHDCFDPASAREAGLDLDRLLWIRCGANPEHALKAVDLLVHAGGFGLLVFDLADVREEVSRRIPLASWFRLRRAIEPTPTVLLLIEQQPNARTCASLILETGKRGEHWSGKLLNGTTATVVARKPAGTVRATFETRSVG
jgi:recombination protein RecA